MAKIQKSVAVLSSEIEDASGAVGAEAAAAAPGGPRSVGRILGLLTIVARRGEGCSLAELSSELGTPKSSLLLLLRPLIAEGYLLRDHNRYLLGPPMYTLAAQIQTTRQPLRLLRPFLEELAARSQESVYVAVLDSESKVATFVDTVPSPKMIRFAMPIGFVRPLYATAAGRLLLAYQDEAWQQDYLKGIRLEPITAHTTTDPKMLMSELEAIRELGMSISIDEAVEGGGAVAAPVYGPDEKIEAALVIAAPTMRLRQQLSSFQRIIRDVANRASGRTGRDSAAA